MILSQINTIITPPTSSRSLLVGLWYLVVSFVLVMTIGVSNKLLAQKINTIRYTVEDGLPSSNIYQILEDEKGYIWITTDKGLAKFDGYTFQNFTIQDGLPSNDVWGIKYDKRGRLWLSTFNKLPYVQDDEIHTIALKDTLIFNAPMIQEYWMGEGEEVYVLISENNVNYLLVVDLRQQSQKILKRNLEYAGYLGYKNGRKWFFNFPKGEIPNISYLEDGAVEEQLLLQLDLSANTAVNRKFVQRKEHIYFFTKEAIWSFNYIGIDKIPVEKIFGEELIIEDVFPSNASSENVFLLKTNKGFHVLDEDLQVLPFLTTSDNFYKSVLQDRTGNIWLSATNGLFLITANARHSEYYPLSTNNVNNNCTAIFVEEDHTIWAANQQNEIWKIEETSSQHWQLSQKDYTNLPLKHLFKWEETLVAAGDFGMFLLSPATLQKTTITAQYFKKNNSSSAIFDLKEGNFLPLPVKSIKKTEQGLLLSKWSGVTQTSIKGGWLKDEHIIKGRTYVSEQDAEGKIWLGRKNGLWCYEKEQLTYIGKKHPLLQHPINDLKIDQQGNIWIATDGFGVLLFDREQVFEIKESKTSTPNRLFIDEKNQVWSATNRGVSKVSVTSTLPFEYEYGLITTAHGLIANEVNNVIVKDSLVYAATNAGLTIIDHTRQLLHNPPTLYIRQITANNKKVESDSLYEGSYQNNNIKIAYVSLSYKSRGNITYEYKMSGIDEDWQTTSSTVREYPQLMPGDYTFSVRAKDIDGYYSDLKKVQITIKAPWWETAWVKLLAVLGTIGIGVGIFQWRIRTIRQQEEEKTRINQQFAELELQALRAQMNPHFIFNSMNSIQNYVYTKDKREAGKYIVQFSRLMRLFLNASHEKFISLKQELEILEYYVELEKKRFEDKFEYQFIIDETLPLENIQIPSLILQPYVENAINHGLRHRTSKGNLWIRIRKGSNTTILCEIEDNGIGRAAAQKIREQSVKKHQPRGMAIVAGRQRVLNERNNLNIQIDIIDLKNEEGVATGTSVRVRIPIGEV